MKADSLLRVERLNYVLGGILIIVAAILRPRAEALGVLVGVVLTSANFAMLRHLVFRWTADAAAGIHSNRSLLLIPKMMGLMAAVAIALFVLPISAVAFAIGYSVFVVSITIEGTLSVFRSQESTADTDSPTQPEPPLGHPGTNASDKT